MAASKGTPDGLRRRAEELLALQPEQISERHASEAQELLQELQVQRIELELQHDELLRVHEALDTSHQRLVRLFQKAPVGYVVLDPVGLILRANETFGRMIDADETSLAGRAFAELLDEVDQPVFRARYSAFFKHPGNKRFQVRFRAKAAASMVAQIEAVPDRTVFDGSGEALLLNVTDVTERVEAEQERSKLQAELQHAQKLETVGRLAGGIAHDFNNLLTAILGNISLIQMELPEDHDLGGAFEDIESAAQRAASLTNQLLAFSRKSLLQPKLLDPNRLLQGMREMLERTIGTDIELSLHLGSDIGLVEVDPGQFEQAVGNLVVNARDAMPFGGRLRIESGRASEADVARLSPPDLASGPFVCISISDTGTGMDEVTMRRAVEPFFTTKPLGEGTGLGLSTTYGIVRQHGGLVGLSSEVARGTTVTLLFPEKNAARRAGLRNVAAADLRTGQELVLLVDDEPSVRKVATRVLTRCGYDVRAAGCGADAIALVEREALCPDLLLTDIVMPQLGGAELARILRKRFPYLKVVFTSGYAEEVNEARDLPNSRFVAKPYSPRDLSEVIRELLES